MEPILQDWETFAKTLLHAKHLSKAGLRDHAKKMLLAFADDIETDQSESERLAKSKGHESDGVDSWAKVHGGDRQNIGFSIIETVSEFRALRASVVSQWTKTHQANKVEEFEDLTRFHEAIDQAVAESLERYAIVKEAETRLFGAILLASPDPIYVLDLEGRFVYANKATSDLFGLKFEEVIGKSTIDLGFPFAAEFQRNQQKVIADQSTHRGKFAYTFASGSGERFEYLLAPVLDEDAKIESMVCICRDITEQVLAEEKIWHTAHHDPLTGLPNRRLFLDRLEQEIKHVKRGSSPMALLFMDLDGFKDVNDTLGHEAGDFVLSDVAKRLNACVRENDTVARLGGDEFTVILSGTHQREDVELVAQTIIDALAKPFSVADNTVQISVSIGITLFPQDADTSAALLISADKAMYNAKKSGASRMCFYQPDNLQPLARLGK